MLKRKQSVLVEELSDQHESTEVLRPRFEKSKCSQIINQLAYDQKHVYITLIISGQRVQATINTGATCSFISQSFAKTLRNATKPETRPIVVRMAEGTERLLTEYLLITFQLGERSYELKTLVLPDSTDDLVLGMDFLIKTETSITCANQTVTLCKNPIPNVKTTNFQPSSKETSPLGTVKLELREENVIDEVNRHSIIPLKIPPGEEVLLEGRTTLSNRALDIWHLSEADIEMIMRHIVQAKISLVSKRKHQLKFKRSIGENSVSFRLSKASMASVVMRKTQPVVLP